MERRPEGEPGLRLPGVAMALIAVNLLVEAVLLAADRGLWGSPLWRVTAYQYGGFWSGLLRDWQPNYPGQAVLMFATYAFLHGGPGHALGNMATLATLTPSLARRLGAWRLAVVYALSALGGAVVFGLLSATAAPMVGASGAIFGLAGAALVLYWEEQRRPGGVLAALAVLAALNLVTWVLAGGQLAWQTHLGGLLTGMAATRALGRAPDQPRVR
ncbi:rhomboid family intramembrane serine protease [Rubellimicrobium aerolatum]|uniref:Rhomboid family intramembrane serine protease n=1 Tax=Rubellimicrobium aerolatum TaxID=490979 RepID=A0ABW0S9I5_9RHOB|nr:membrane associated rhomboid family serine protease [Rubellimicrobium aerolatum]